jgi:hypothetical protein
MIAILDQLMVLVIVSAGVAFVLRYMNATLKREAEEHRAERSKEYTKKKKRCK